MIGTRIHPVTALLVAGLLGLSACAPAGSFTILPDEKFTAKEIAETETPEDAETAESEMRTMVSPSLTETQKSKILAKYAHLDPKHLVPTTLLEKVVLYFDANIGNFPNRDYIGVYDYSLKSVKSRFFVINMKDGSVLAVHSAHGSGSDRNHDGYVDKGGLKNTPNSLASSEGFAKTVETYNSSKFGYALRMKGLSTTNSNIYKRAVVIHGAAYVQDSAVIQGRSSGCPAVSFSHRDTVVNRLKGGALIYFGPGPKA